MGPVADLLGRVIGNVISRIGENFDRDAIAKALRDTAGDIERGDIVPDSLIAKAKRLAASVAAARRQYRDG